MAISLVTDSLKDAVNAVKDAVKDAVKPFFNSIFLILFIKPCLCLFCYDFANWLAKKTIRNQFFGELLSMNFLYKKKSLIDNIISDIV